MYLISVLLACLFLPVIWGSSDCIICTCLFNMVICDSSSVTEIPLSWPDYTTEFVNQLIYTDTNVTTLRNNTFLNFPRLQSIVITNSQLNEIEEGAFNGIASQLTKINFTSNKLNMINPRWFTDMTSLQQLILSSNTIEFIPANSFTDLIELQTLKLDNNQIKRINEDNVRSLNTTILTEIALGENNFVCDCYLAWLQQLVTTKTSTFSQAVNCTFPSNTSGYNITEVSDLSTYCLGLCVEISCTENSHCVVADEFPTCDCNIGYIPIGEGTYECSTVPVPSSTVLTTSTSLPHTSTSSSSGTTSSSSLTPLSPSVTTTTTTSIHTTTTTIPSTSIPQTTIFTTSVTYTHTSTTLPLSSFLSSSHVTSSSIPSNMDTQVDIAIPILITFLVLCLALLLLSLMIFAIVWGIKIYRTSLKPKKGINKSPSEDIMNPIYRYARADELDA